VHRFAVVSDLERAAVTYIERAARRHAEQQKRRREMMEAWEIKQINRAERAKREGVRA
jgi:serine/threonine-protein kinase RIO1